MTAIDVPSTDTLFDAIDAGDAEALRQLVAARPSVAGIRGALDLSAVRYALYGGRRDLAEVLAEAKPVLDVFDLAALGRADHIRALVEVDSALASATAGDGFTALHLAAFFGGIDAVRVLLDAGANPAAVATNAMAVAPLHSAAAVGANDVCELLIERGASVDARQHGGYTPLHAAAQSGNAALVDILLRHGADRSITTDEGATAADLAEAAGHRAIADRLC